MVYCHINRKSSPLEIVITNILSEGAKEIKETNFEDNFYIILLDGVELLPNMDIVSSDNPT